MEAMGNTPEERADSILASIAQMPFGQQQEAYLALNNAYEVLEAMVRALDLADGGAYHPA